MVEMQKKMAALFEPHSGAESVLPTANIRVIACARAKAKAPAIAGAVVHVEGVALGFLGGRFVRAARFCLARAARFCLARAAASLAR